jgi:hypothetical protein
MSSSAGIQMEHSGHAHDHRSASAFAKRPILTGAAIGFGSLAPHFFLTAEASLGFAAVLIGLIAGIYFGFAVMNGTVRDQFVEFTVAGFFAVSAIFGLLLWPILLPLAYLGHGLWDLAHHNKSRLSLVAIPRWYVPWCAVIDVIIAAGLIGIWTAHGIL